MGLDWDFSICFLCGGSILLCAASVYSDTSRPFSSLTYWMRNLLASTRFPFGLKTTADTSTLVEKVGYSITDCLLRGQFAVRERYHTFILTFGRKDHKHMIHRRGILPDIYIAFSSTYPSRIYACNLHNLLSGHPSPTASLGIEYVIYNATAPCRFVTSDIRCGTEIDSFNSES